MRCNPLWISIPVVVLLAAGCGGRALPVAPGVDGTPAPADGGAAGPPRSDAAGPPLSDAARPPLPDAARPPPLPPPPTQCLPGQQRWCDGLVYSGWGFVSCDPATGRWKTKVLGGKQQLDCHEAPDGRVPNTPCACYHFYFNPACCEQPGCVLPVGTSGQICPPSAGQLCDYCNPVSPECQEPLAKCVVTNSHESFCARDCTTTPCPAGYSCMDVKLKVGSTKQCVPDDLSCFY